ncbi:MAG: helix-turn-helix transcriptional regulator [Treponema sp.]|nr:helix-turn-helix transcriptional regulator [Treponema sp.]
MNTKTQEEFIKNLKFYRNEKKISQEKLAEACDCATGTIGCIECGKALPSFEMIVNIAAALKIHPADLFLRNASSTVSETKKILLTELLPQIENFVEKRL